MHCHIILICLTIYFKVCESQFSSDAEVRPRTPWGSECPRECQCHMTSLSHVTMSRWLTPHNGHRVGDREKSPKFHYSKQHEKTTSGRDATTPLKVAMCILGQDTLLNKLFRRIPHDTQVLTMLQTQESPLLVMMEQQTEHLHRLEALEIRAHSSSYTSHFALGGDALRPLKRLQYLSLKGVDLSATPVGLSKLRALRYLSLEDNQLDAFPKDSLNGLLSLEELSITHNGLREVPPLAFVDMPSLRRLHLHDNRIQNLDANSFVNLDELEVLDLTSNNVSEISMISFPPLPKLLWLHLQNNPIRVIFLNAFHFLNGTSILTLGHKEQLMHIMKLSFAGLTSLKSLSIPNLENTILEKDMFQGLNSLRTLTLHGQIKAIGPEAFSGVYDLEQLVLRHCQLHRIAADAFAGLKNLRALDLSGNALSKLPLGVFDSLKSLQELEIQQNNLHYLPTQLLSHLHLQMLRLEDNPWHCTCAMAKWDRLAVGKMKVVNLKKCQNTNSITSALNAKDIQALSLEVRKGERGGGCRRLRVRYIKDPNFRPICQSPAEVKGKRVFEVIRKDLRCFDQHESKTGQ